MTWQDPIVEEVRAIREAYAARFQYDLQAIYRDLKAQERQHGWQTWPSRHDRRSRWSER